MTNREAIEILKIERDNITHTLIMERIEAMDMAISALREQDSKTRNCDTCKHNPPSKKWPCADCDMREPADRWEAQDAPDTNVGGAVNRQVAIDTEGLEEEIRCEMCKNPMHTDRGCDGHCKYDEILYEKIIQILDKRITQLPSAQPEHQCCECKHYEGVHGVMGHAPCNYWKIGGVLWDDFCSRWEGEMREDDTE